MNQVNLVVKKWMEEVGMQVTIDDIGNLIGATGEDNDKPTLAMGSHLDTVVDAGKYDGILGILIPIEIVGQLEIKTLPFNIKIISFADEEGSRFQAKCVGSRSACGLLEPTIFDVEDVNGVSLYEAIEKMGGKPENILKQSFFPNDFLAFLEFHIEQGITLEQEDTAVGLVKSIVGQTNLKVDFFGTAGHAGTLSMQQRNDSLVTAAQFIIQVERYALKRKNLVATVGMVQNAPNAPNCVSGHTIVSLDIRHANDLVREKAAKDITAMARQLSVLNEQNFKCTILGSTPSVFCDKEILEILEEACPYPYTKLHSGAGHDSMHVANICPIGLVFIRCKDGISHNPLEHVSKKDLKQAFDLGVEFVNHYAEKMTDEAVVKPIIERRPIIPTPIYKRIPPPSNQ